MHRSTRQSGEAELAGFKHIKDVLAGSGLGRMAKLFEERDAIYGEVSKLRRIAKGAKLWKALKHAQLLDGRLTPTAYAGELAGSMERLIDALDGYCDYLDALKAEHEKGTTHADA